MSITVPCPTCATPVEWSEQSPWRPFCSERCRLIDLGEWFNENHRISEPIDPETPPQQTSPEH
ncbi:DNA gyrase inhibitor [Marichromatium purpuratum 984]|uniref:DNA gyrase inhibitor YacG n=1 Tax=Marichromatium purpuratum 984 TaxID=765910 RepID=W0E5P4_MARPU|nr:DNA gyrase inhibitor YacG [Marichromatium purpuratum]AHF04863.1 DNA gyrase inhibitor [Marichromatium purpuratum 984]